MHARAYSERMASPMTTFLLWNVHRKQLDAHIVRLIQQHVVDVLLLIEHPKPDDMLFSQLNTFGSYQRVASHNRFGVYVRFDSSLMRRVRSPVQNERVDYWDVQ